VEGGEVMSKSLIQAIESGDASAIKENFISVINSKVAEYLDELKKDLAYDMLDEYVEDEDDGEEVDEARVKRVNRIRGGVVQRRKVVATDKNYRTVGQGTKVVRMSASERRNRKIAQKKAARKRKAGASRASIKRKLTNRKRDTRGFNK
jgi:hypothetical protein